MNMLSTNIKLQFHLHDWQEAVDEMTEEALESYLTEAVAENTDEKKYLLCVL